MNPVPRWAVYTTWLLAFVGLALSSYLVYLHFSAATTILGCPVSTRGGGGFNCEAVTTSPQSYLFHIPVSVLGIAQYFALIVVLSPWAWRANWRWLALARFAMTAIGVVVVIYLVWCEAIVIGNWCEYCTGVHVVTVVLFLVMTRVAPQQLGWVRAPEPELAVPPR